MPDAFRTQRLDLLPTPQSACAFALCTAALLGASPPAAAQPLPAASPESVGFDSARLKKLEDYMAGVVAEGRVARV